MSRHPGICRNGGLLAALRLAPATVMVTPGDLTAEPGVECPALVLQDIPWLFGRARLLVIWTTPVIGTRPIRERFQDSRAVVQALIRKRGAWRTTRRFRGRLGQGTARAAAGRSGRR